MPGQSPLLGAAVPAVLRKNAAKPGVWRVLDPMPDRKGLCPKKEGDTVDAVGRSSGNAGDPHLCVTEMRVSLPGRGDF